MVEGPCAAAHLRIEGDMVSSLRSTVNLFMSPLGIEVRRRGAESVLLSKSRERLRDAAEELEKLARSTIFPGLPCRENRTHLMAQLAGTHLSEALHLVWHLNKALALDGDVCEFGVAQGATSALMANEISHTGKTLWLFDSFEGLPKPTDRDVLIDDIFNLGSIEQYQGKMAFGQEQVISRLNRIGFPLDRVAVVPGFIEKTSKYANLPKKICFAYIDFDFYEPIKIALELLDATMPIGGAVVVDDYGFFSAGAKTAVDEFAAANHPRYSKKPSPEWASKFCVLVRER